MINIKEKKHIYIQEIESIMFPLLFVLILHFCSTNIEAQLQVGFYQNTCPNAERIVREEVNTAFLFNHGIAAGLVRMHFHDCFVRGCDGSVLIDSTPGNSAEKDGPPNANSLRGFEVINSAKARIEQQCPGKVSCADILAFAARDSVVITGGFGWDVPAGRRDGRISRAIETLVLPPPFANLGQITQSFANKNLTQDEMIALVGAHTIGRSHCTSFSNRLYNFNTANGQDPTLNPFYAAILKLQCPRGSQGTVNPSTTVPMNPTPSLFENSYYKDVLNNKGLFTSDQTLTTSQDALNEVTDYATNNIQWLQDFAAAMIKMSKIEVLTGTAGEIRLVCNRIN